MSLAQSTCGKIHSPRRQEAQGFPHLTNEDGCPSYPQGQPKYVAQERWTSSGPLTALHARRPPGLPCGVARPTWETRVKETPTPRVAGLLP
ncbi:UNVERIFIED_CONTAM: hypothetical protein Sradi_3247700 [Sesamum radiatum]|uniref:Uncharacterized protein n=1 Tax=Sesamum radiatum TaxID=300843 RepID=A0AAW2QZI6_SESRA